MLSLAHHILRSWLFLTVLCYSTNAYRVSSGEKTMNLKIGFDLTQGENGAPSLRIRDFEGSSELNQRADESVVEKTKSSPSVRADSFSDSSEKGVDDKEEPDQSSKEVGRAGSSDEYVDNSKESDRRFSTKGFGRADYEPEENPSVHAKYKESSESDSDAPHHRGKRDVSFRRLVAKLRSKNRGVIP